MTMKKYILIFGLLGCFALPKAQEMVDIAAGSFSMGNASYVRESPARTVNINRFYLSKYPITNAQFDAFLNSYGSATVKDGEYVGKPLVVADSWGVVNTAGTWSAASGYESFPAVKVTWYGASEYCKAAGGRLPTEAEWEYAAKGGASQQAYTFSGSSTATTVAWFYDNSGNINKAVGTKTANSIGLFDMSGNVYQWCSDWFGRYGDFGTSGDLNPKGPATGASKIIRGGYRSLGSGDLHMTNRESISPDESYNFVGFRLAKDYSTAVTTQKETGITVYPNPASEYIRISAPAEISEVDIVDCEGKSVYSSTHVINAVSVSSFPAGIYFVKVKSLSNVAIQKIVIRN